jgi:hypothetical protein
MNVNIEIFYKSNPDAKLKDYFDACEKADEEIRKNNELKNNWYKELANRYFIINFNGFSFCAVKVDKWPDTNYENLYLCYNINSDEKTIVKENRKINRYWFNNPFENSALTNTKCTEISEDEFNSIAKIYEQVKDLTDSINIKKYFE